MYLPSHFAETRTEVLHDLIRAHPLAALVTLDSNGLNANHMPFEIESDPAPFGTLIGHVARANPVWQDFSKEVEALLIFQGAQRYITPSWYVTKQENAKVVPTYNYAVVHACGPLRIIEDRAWLRALVERLTNRYEAAMPQPWKVTDAPDEYIEKMLGAIVGIEIPITRLVGKWKVSQNRTATDREAVVKGLQNSYDADAGVMANLVKEFAKP
ncbi:MAG: FMN-binding negative transcriptional regulator [Burkholderiales bacterium]